MTTIGDVVTKLSDTGRGEVVDSLTALGISPSKPVLSSHDGKVYNLEEIKVDNVKTKDGEEFEATILTM